MFSVSWEKSNKSYFHSMRWEVDVSSRGNRRGCCKYSLTNEEKLKRNRLWQWFLSWFVNVQVHYASSHSKSIMIVSKFKMLLYFWILTCFPCVMSIQVKGSWCISDTSWNVSADQVSLSIFLHNLCICFKTCKMYCRKTVCLLISLWGKWRKVLWKYLAASSQNLPQPMQLP